MPLRRKPVPDVDGRLIGKRYRLGERLGSGGMGAVWVAYDELVGREVALKEAHLDSGPGATARVERIMREARAAARIDHPAVVTVHDVVTHDGRPWIVMERVRGENLDERLVRELRLSEAEAARIAAPVAEALAAAHACGVLHRDVKPANVLLGLGGRVVLTDFGIARIEGDSSLTRSGEFVGSFEFTAPESMGGARPQATADLWSLGVMLFRMIEGWSPFRRATVHATVTAVLTTAVPRPVWAADLAPLITALLDRDPAGRPTAQEAAAALRALAHPSPTPPAPDPAPPAPAPALGGKARRTRRGLMAGGAVAALTAGTALTLAAAGLLHGTGDPDVSGRPQTSPAAGRELRPPAHDFTPPSPAAGYRRVSEAPFTVELPNGWQRLGPASGPVFTFGAGAYRATIVAGRDSTGSYGDEPTEYESVEPELRAFREASFSTVSGVTPVKIRGRDGARGTYQWKDARRGAMYARNAVEIIDGRYHTVLVEGPDTKSGRGLVSRVAGHAFQTYTPPLHRITAATPFHRIKPD